MKHWTPEEKSKVVQEALTPGNTFHSVAPKYGLSAMTVYKWHQDIEGYIHLLEAVSNTVSLALEEGEELVWVAVPDLMSQRGNWAIAILMAIVLLPALLVISVQTQQTYLAAFVIVVALVIAGICWIVNAIYSASIDIDYAVTDKRILCVKRAGYISGLVHAHRGIQTADNSNISAHSYYFETLQKVLLEENKDDVGSLTLIDKDGKKIGKLRGISHVRGMWESLPANLRSSS